MMLQLVDLVRRIQDNPELAAIIGLIFILLGAAQYFLGPKQDWVETYRKKYWLQLHEFLSLYGGYAAGPVDLEEYTYSVKIGEEELEKILYRGNYHRNVLAAKKSRRLPSGVKQWSLNSWVHRESLLADMQDHATNFPGHKDGEIDIYHHYETSWVSHPFKHYFYVDQRNGDPEGTLEKALEQADVEYYRDEEWLSKFE